MSDRAIAAVVATAAAHGALCESPLVLSDRANLIVHLSPAPLVARIATTTAAMRPDVGEWLAREVSMGSHLARRGLAIAPSDLLPPGPHQKDGFVFTFWRYMERRAELSSIGDAAGALGRLHDGLRDYQGALPLLAPFLIEVPRLLAQLDGLALADRALLSGSFERIAKSLVELSAPIQPLHGDANITNLFVTADGLRWADFEDCCAGPVAWDLACLLRKHRPEVRAAALERYGAVPEGLELCIEARELQAVVYLQILARRFPAEAGRAKESMARWRRRAER